MNHNKDFTEYLQEKKKKKGLFHFLLKEHGGKPGKKNTYNANN